jgi:hypothetical protein
MSVVERGAALREWGKALYGSDWQTDMARGLGVSSRSVRYWLAGRPLPADMPERVLVLIDKREQELRKLRAALSHPRRLRSRKS